MEILKQEEVPNDRELYSEDKIELPLELQKELSEIGIFKIILKIDR